MLTLCSGRLARSCSLLISLPCCVMRPAVGDWHPAAGRAGGAGGHAARFHAHVRLPRAQVRRISPSIHSVGCFCGVVPALLCRAWLPGQVHDAGSFLDALHPTHSCCFPQQRPRGRAGAIQWHDS